MNNVTNLAHLLRELKTVAPEDLKVFKSSGVAGAKCLAHELAETISEELDARLITAKGGVDFAAFSELERQCPDLQLQLKPLEQDSFGWLRGGLFLSLHNQRFYIAFG